MRLVEEGQVIGGIWEDEIKEIGRVEGATVVQTLSNQQPPPPFGCCIEM